MEYVISSNVRYIYRITNILVYASCFKYHGSLIFMTFFDYFRIDINSNEWFISRRKTSMKKGKKEKRKGKKKKEEGKESNICIHMI